MGTSETGRLEAKSIVRMPAAVVLDAGRANARTGGMADESCVAGVAIACLLPGAMGSRLGAWRDGADLRAVERVRGAGTIGRAPRARRGMAGRRGPAHAD